MGRYSLKILLRKKHCLPNHNTNETENRLQIDLEPPEASRVNLPKRKATRRHEICRMDPGSSAAVLEVASHSGMQYHSPRPPGRRLPWTTKIMKKK